MGLFFRNWLEEGFYEEDSQGDLTKITDPEVLKEAASNGTLYEHDGISISKKNLNSEEIFSLDEDFTNLNQVILLQINLNPLYVHLYILVLSGNNNSNNLIRYKIWNIL